MSQQPCLQKRQLGSFLTYRSEKYQEYKNKYKNLRAKSLFGIIRDEWNGLTKEEKQKYSQQYRNTQNQDQLPNSDEEEKNEGNLECQNLSSQKHTDKSQEKIEQKLAIVINNQERDDEKKEQDFCNDNQTSNELKNISDSNDQKEHQMERILRSSQIILNDNGRGDFTSEEAKNDDEKMLTQNQKQWEKEKLKTVKDKMKLIQQDMLNLHLFILQLRHQTIKYQQNDQNNTDMKQAQLIQQSSTNLKSCNLVLDQIDKLILQ